MERNVFTAEQETWLKALESGEYRQCRKELHSDDGDAHCCLGVADHLGLAIGDDFGELNLEVDNRLMLRGAAGQFARVDADGNAHLVGLNDEAEWSFAQIAAFIRANPWQVFTNFDPPTPSIAGGTE